MLTHITLSDYAIVDHLELELAPGMSVITGETGAGKSILLDALGLALGDRADSSMIRHGSERGEVSVGFLVRDLPQVSAWLEEREVAMDEECLLRRTISRDGRSRGYINGQPFPVQALRELGEMLVDLHGQHTHQSLLHRSVQRQTLDAFASNEDMLAQLNQAYRTWHERQQELATLTAKQADRDARLELLHYQVSELEALNLQAGDLETIEQEHQRLAHASQLLEASEQALYQLYEDENGPLISQLQRLNHKLEQLQAVDSRLDPILEYLRQADILLQEAVGELRHYQDAIESDPAQLAQLEQRLAEIHALSRKHGCLAQQLPERLAQLSQELTTLEQADVRLGNLKHEIAAAQDNYRRLAHTLSKVRQQAAKKLSKQVSENMQQLGMRGGRFDIALHPLEQDDFGPHGMERVEFMVSANPGQPLQPLNKVASGGELSRISLAIQVITAASHGIPTLIFDEVDVGIGGGTAEIVGHMLRRLSSHRQVLCVTHQPQVAALADHHLHVSKQLQTEQVDTRIATLSTEQRVEELARMLGGLDITAQTLSHAREMLERAQGA